MRRLTLMLTAAALVTASVNAAASTPSSGRLRLKPSRPLVNQRVTAEYRVAKRLPAGTHYELFLAVHTSDTSGRCATFAHHTLKGRPLAGQAVSVSFAPSNDRRVVRSAYWCAGAATLTVDRDRNGDGDGADLVSLTKLNFQFTALP